MSPSNHLNLHSRRPRRVLNHAFQQAGCQLPDDGEMGVTVQVDFVLDAYPQPQDIAWTLYNGCSGGLDGRRRPYGDGR